MDKNIRLSSGVRFNKGSLILKIFGYLLVMEEGLQKFIKRMMLKKYPFILEIYVIKSFGSPPHFESKDCYEVFLVIFEEDLGKLWGTREYIDELAKYMGIPICGVYNEYVDSEEWEEMKSNSKT